MRILKYEILARQGAYSLCLTELAELVNEYMDRGWQPLGGLSITELNPNFCATQTMVYYEEATDIEVVKSDRTFPVSCSHRLAVAVNRRGKLIYLDNPSVVNDSLIHENDIFKFCPDCGKCLIDVYGNRE